MKKKLFALALAIGLSLCLSFFTACQHKHSYSSVTVKPTCTEKGYTLHICDCGESYIDTYVDVTKTHNYTSVVTAPTCTEKGYTTYTCVCGESYKADETAALGHEYSAEWTTDKQATCLNQGEKSRHCIRCDSRTDVTMTEYSDHNYVNGVCTVCREPAVTEATDLEFKLSDDENYYIVTGIGNEQRTKFIIPSSYNGKPVKEIAEDAFSQDEAETNDDILPIKEVVIPETITSVGQYAFYMCAKLESITFLGNSDLTIGEHAFEYCMELENVTISGKVKSIGEYAFAYCYTLTNVYINDLENWLDIEFAFGGNPTAYAQNFYLNKKLLRNLVIPNTVTRINDWAFYCVPSLKSVTLHDSVTSIGAFAFDGCENLQVNTFDDAWYLGTSSNPYFALIKLQSDTKTSCEINENTQIIAGGAFYGCKGLETIVIPDGIKIIDNYTFSECENLATVTIPASVTTIGDYAFQSCKKLANINLNAVKYIGEYAFTYCDGLKTIKIPDSVMSIGNYAFYSCDGLQSVEIRTDSANATNQITEIGEYAFAHCNKLAEVIIRRGVFKISKGMFYECDELNEITLPTGMTYIDREAFAYCYKLEKIHFNGTQKEWNSITKAEYWKDDNATFTVFYKES